MNFSWREPTIRDFSKSREGRFYLGTLFDYKAFPIPKLVAFSNKKSSSKDVLGRAFELVLQLLIERQNEGFDFLIPFQRQFTDLRTKHAREFKHFLKSGELSDGFLNYLVSLGNGRQKTFQTFRSRSRTSKSDELRRELRRMYELAKDHHWKINQFFHQGRISGGYVAAEVDFILDTCLIEVKAVGDGRRHEEHLSQIFTYFLLTQAPVRRSQSLVIDKIGIYYARYGILVAENISRLITFQLQNIRKISFDFMFEFSCWKAKKCRTGNGESNEELIRKHALIEVLREVYPRPKWVSQALIKPYENKRIGRKYYSVPRPISLPENFLLETI
jgi:hypothetical protein